MYAMIGTYEVAKKPATVFMFFIDELEAHTQRNKFLDKYHRDHKQSEYVMTHGSSIEAVLTYEQSVCKVVQVRDKQGGTLVLR